MDNLSEKLMEMLSSQEGLEKIKGLGNLLNLGGAASSEKTETLPQNNAEPMAKLPTDTLNTVMKLMPILSSINKEDENTKFLFALRPLLSETRRRKLDESVKILQMIRLLPALKSQGIL